MAAEVSTSTSTAPAPPPARPSGHRRQVRHPKKKKPNGGDESAPAESNAAGSSQPAQSGRRRGGGRGQPARDASLAMRPSTVAPPAPVQPSNPSNADNSAAENAGQRSSRRGRGGAATRGSRGGRGQNINTSRMVNGRQFGGQLTTQEPGAFLHGDAPSFTPGHPIATGPRDHQPRKRRFSKSVAPDLATRIHEDIDNGLYECAICTNEVQRNSKMWSCQTCWTVFHLGCIKKWSTKEGSAAAQQQPQGGELPPPRQWRCPGCNLPKDTLPSQFQCWCGKEQDPKSLVGLPPFSCGQTCSRTRTLPKKCPHPCPELCHAGPCPPCTHMGPAQSCFCGKEVSTRKCVDTDYDRGWSCNSPCGELMPCGEHICERSCHEGLCGACEVRVDARCYCGQVEKAILCCDKDDEKESQLRHVGDDGEKVVESWIGLFGCGNICQRTFDCGKHSCKEDCHPQTPDAHCPRSPEIVSHCPCGKTELQEISPDARTTCEDPIPNCKRPCHSTLPCGHMCEQVCHSGDCDPCFKKVPITCRCGRTTSTTTCHQGVEEPPQCVRVCKVSLNCGRHECSERCCPGESKASKRQQNRRKLRPLDSAPQRPIEDGFEAEHICTRPCGRLLKCGNHTCQELCHKGPCGSCREAIFDEISCNCGRTVLQPPLPCGTKSPPCRFQCGRPKACGHPQVAHTCHQDDESCPKCPFLTVKPCMCGKKVLKNQPCWLAEARCGEVCGKKLKCGAHRCRKPCHKPGDCEDAGSTCKQQCGKERSCEHPCTNACHVPSACDESKPCQYKIFITCPCQHLKQEMRCLAAKDSEGNATRSLKCDDECARLERNRKLAMALNVDPESQKDDHIPYAAETLSLYQQSPQWAQNQEREFRVFAMSPEEKRFRFKPMQQHQRAFIHALAEDFGLDSQSMDPEPHRHVAIFKTPRFVSAPAKTLADCGRIRYNQRLAAAPAAPATESTKAGPLKASNLVGDPFNAFLLSNARFGLTLEELRLATKPALSSPSNLSFDISFLPSEEVVMVASAKLPVADRALESALQCTKPNLVRAIGAEGLGSVQLCRVDASLNILRRESDTASGGGWSQVAAKAAAKRSVAAARTGGGVAQGKFTVLSLGSAGKGKGKGKGKEKGNEKEAKEEVVVDDWEVAEEVEEERERGGGAASPSFEAEKDGTGGGEMTGQTGDALVAVEAESSAAAQDDISLAVSADHTPAVDGAAPTASSTSPATAPASTAVVDEGQESATETQNTE